jgi:hypothetical protein
MPEPILFYDDKIAQPIVQRVVTVTNTATSLNPATLTQEVAVATNALTDRATSLSPVRLPEEVSAVTTQLASMERVFSTYKAGAPSANRSEPRLLTLSAGVRLPDDVVTSETTE